MSFTKPRRWGRASGDRRVEQGRGRIRSSTSLAAQTLATFARNRPRNIPEANPAPEPGRRPDSPSSTNDLGQSMAVGGSSDISRLSEVQLTRLEVSSAAAPVARVEFSVTVVDSAAYKEPLIRFASTVPTLGTVAGDRSNTQQGLPTPAGPALKSRFIKSESGRPDSNRRRPAWEAGILPTELRPQSRRQTPRRQRAIPRLADDAEDLAVAEWGVNCPPSLPPACVTSRRRTPGQHP